MDMVIFSRFLRTKRDGMGLSIEFSIIPLRNETNEIEGLIAIIRDVTKRFEEIRALKQKLKTAAKDLQVKGAEI